MKDCQFLYVIVDKALRTIMSQKIKFFIYLFNHVDKALQYVFIKFKMWEGVLFIKHTIWY